jgi:flagellar protein FliL
MQWLAILIGLTIVAAGAGALSGLHLLTTAERAADAQKSAGARPVASVFAGNARLHKLTPVVTNLEAPQGLWARIEASIVTDNISEEDANILAVHINEDITAYLRSVSLPQIEGARGLQFLREDLNERAVIRSGGKIRELVIESLVIQ